MALPKRILAVLALMLLGVRAQDEPELVVESVACRVGAVRPPEGATQLVAIERGSRDGVVVGWRGTAFAVRTGADKALNGDALGRAEVIRVVDDRAAVRVTLATPEAPRVVRVGDAVELRVRVPERERSILWQLAKKRIFFRGEVPGETYCDDRTLRDAETPELVEELFGKMLDRIRKSGRLYGEQEALLQTLDRGRYKGRTPRDILVGATRRELLDFLQFVATYPGKYYGQVWRIDETFATWVINAAPWSAEEIADKLAAATDDAGIDALVGTLRTESVGGDPARMLSQRAERLAHSDPAEAHRLHAIATRVARALGDEERLRWLAFTRAYILAEEEGKLDACIEAYEQAAAAFREAGEGVGESYCLNNLAWALERSGSYLKALAAYRAANELKERIGADSYSRGLTLRALGDIQRKLGDYTGALASYERAETFFRRLDALDGLTDALSGRAKALAKLGRNKEAAEVYAKLRAEHARVGEREDEAATLENIGSQNWDLGDYEAAYAAYAESLAIRRELGQPSSIATALTNMGRLQENLGRFDKARTLIGEALAIHREQTKDAGNEAEALADLGRIAARELDYAQALKLLQEALALQQRVGNRTGEAYTHWQIGRVHQQRYEYEEAEKAHAEAIRLYRAAGDRSSLVLVLDGRSGLAYTLKDFEQAFADAREALELARAMKSPGDEATALLTLGRLHFARREYGKAGSVYGEALDLARRIGNRLLEAETLRWTGQLAAEQFERDAARAAYDAALAIYASPSLNDPTEIARTRNLLAYLVYGAGRFDEAAAMFRESIAGEGVDATVRNEAREGLGWVLQLRGDLAGARAEFEAAAAHAQDNEWAVANTRLALASIYDSLGESGNALAEIEKARALYEALRNDWGRAAALNQYAHALLRQGDAARALEYVQKALPFAVSSRDRGAQLVVLGTWGAAARDLGRYDEALEKFGQTLRLAQGDGIRVAEVQLLTGRTRRAQAADVLAAGGDAAAELAAGQEALAAARAAFGKLGARVFLGRTLKEEGELALLRGEPGAALAAAGPALKIAEETGSPHLLWQAHDVAARAHEALGDLDAAEASRRAAIAVLDRLRAGVGNDERAQREFLRSKIGVYEGMADLLGRRIDAEKDPERRKRWLAESLEFVARARFEVLRRGVDDAKGTGSAAVDALLERIDRAKRDIARLEEEIAKARAAGNTALESELTKELATSLERLAELHDNLTAADHDFAARVKFNPAYFEEWEALPENARLAIYFPGKTRLYVWVYSHEGFVSWTQHDVARAELDRLVGGFRDLVDEVIEQARTSKGRGFGPEAEANEDNPAWYRENCRRTRHVLRELHRHLIEPVAARIEGADPLLIMPYGMLSYLPFEALLDADGRFLGERTRTAYFVHKDHMTKSLLRLYRPRKKKPDVWVAYADPVGKLSSAIEEVGEIGPLFPEREIHTQETGTATEAQLREIRADCTILHFATHGYLNGVKPAETYLELAPAPPSDGKLMQMEIWPAFRETVPCVKKRNLRLVVLSACETARAANAPEAEVLGMPDKFAAVGSPAVVASLWSVYTWSTTDLMVEFYRRVAKEGQDTATALLEARRALLQNRARGRYAHPYYWAPFLLFGDWR